MKSKDKIIEIDALKELVRRLHHQVVQCTGVGLTIENRGHLLLSVAYKDPGGGTGLTSFYLTHSDNLRSVEILAAEISKVVSIYRMTKRGSNHVVTTRERRCLVARR